MKYIKSFKVFENAISTQTNSPAGAIPGQAPSLLPISTVKSKNVSRKFRVERLSISEQNLSYDSSEISKSTKNSIPRNYNDFERMITENFKFDVGESDSVNEGASIGLLALGTSLSLGQLIIWAGKLIRFVINQAKKWGLLPGEKWESTKLEKWGEWYIKYMKKIIFRPLATILCRIGQPFIHIMEIFANNIVKNQLDTESTKEDLKSNDLSEYFEEIDDSEPKKQNFITRTSKFFQPTNKKTIGNLTNHCTKDRIEELANTSFYLTIFCVLSLSSESLFHTFGAALLGKIGIASSLKLGTSAAKIWEIKCLSISHAIKDNKKFENLVKDKDVFEIAHAISVCLEEKGIVDGLKDTLKFKFKFSGLEEGSQVYNCIWKKLSEHH
jgi:hypothetical protein